MTEDERLHELMLSSDFAVRPSQLEVFKRVLNFFIDMAAEGANKIESVELVPYNLDGVITASLTSFEVSDDRLKRFTEALSDMASISIEVADDSGVLVRATIPDVFIPIFM